MEQNERKSSGINIGSASIIMVFSVLCLTIFAVLSFLSANNELKLATKSADTVANYYDADTKAVVIEGQIREIIANNADEKSAMVAANNSKIEGLVASMEEDGCHFNYATTMDDNQELQVELLYDGENLTTVKWQLQNVAAWSADGGIHLWDGEF